MIVYKIIAPSLLVMSCVFSQLLLNWEYLLRCWTDKDLLFIFSSYGFVPFKPNNFDKSCHTITINCENSGAFIIVYSTAFSNIFLTGENICFDEILMRTKSSVKFYAFDDWKNFSTDQLLAPHFSTSSLHPHRPWRAARRGNPPLARAFAQARRVGPVSGNGTFGTYPYTWMAAITFTG